MRGILAGLALAAALALFPAPAQAQWSGTSTQCDVPYDFGVSGFFGSNCRSTNAYAGWGYGGAQVNQYAVGGWWSYPQASTSVSYSPWNWYGSSTISCRAWGVC